MFTHFFAEAAARVGAAIGAAKSGESEAPAAPGTRYCNFLGIDYLLNISVIKIGKQTKIF